MTAPERFSQKTTALPAVGVTTTSTPTATHELSRPIGIRLLPPEASAAGVSTGGREDLKWRLGEGVFCGGRSPRDPDWPMGVSTRTLVALGAIAAVVGCRVPVRPPPAPGEQAIAERVA